MERKLFPIAVALIIAMETYVIGTFTHASLKIIPAIALLVVPAFYLGQDFWSGIYSRLTSRFQWLTEDLHWFTRLMLRWVFVSLPPALVLLVLNALIPGQFELLAITPVFPGQVVPVASYGDVIRLVLGMGILHGYVSLLFVCNRQPASISNFYAWYKRVHAEDLLDTERCQNA